MSAEYLESRGKLKRRVIGGVIFLALTSGIGSFFFTDHKLMVKKAKPAEMVVISPVPPPPPSPPPPPPEPEPPEPEEKEMIKQEEIVESPEPGYLRFQATESMDLLGSVASKSVSGGRGAAIDISTPARRLHLERRHHRGLSKLRLEAA